MAENRELGRWDQIGISASVLCILHCTFTPIFIFFLPVLGEWFRQPVVHGLLGGIVIPVGFYAFINGYARHQKKPILILGSLGLAGITAGLAIDDFAIETFFTIAGGACLSIAHFLNLRTCRSH